MSIFPPPVFGGLPSLSDTSTVTGTPGYDVLTGDARNNSYNLQSTNTRPGDSFILTTNYFYDLVIEPANIGIDAVLITLGLPRQKNNSTGFTSVYTTFTIPDNVENAESIQIAGPTDFNYTINGNSLNNTFVRIDRTHSLDIYGLGGNDLLHWNGIGGLYDGGDGVDFLRVFSSASDNIFANRPDGFLLTNGLNTLQGRNVEIIQFLDYAVAVESNFPFSGLLLTNLSQTKALAAAYQTLLGGIPTMVGYDFLIKANVETNFGAGVGPVFNDENIFINVVNALVQGNPTAASTFAGLAAGPTLADKVLSLYRSVIPATKQTLEGAQFLIRPEGLAFYESVARERGITSENGGAVVAFASLLKIAVDGRSGIGNPVNDLVAAIANGSARLQSGLNSGFAPIENADGTLFDADDAPDAMPGFAGPPPLSLLGTVDDANAGLVGV